MKSIQELPYKRLQRTKCPLREKLGKGMRVSLSGRKLPLIFRV